MQNKYKYVFFTYLAEIVITTVCSIIFAFVVSKINPQSWYVDTSGHNAIAASVMLGILGNVFIFLLLFAFNCIKHPISILLCLFGFIVGCVYVDWKASVVVNVASVISCIICYSYISSKQQKKKKGWAFIIQELVYILVYFYSLLMIDSLLTEDIFGNSVHNSCAVDILFYLFIAIAIAHVGWLLWKWLGKKLKNNHGRLDITGSKKRN